MQTPPSTTRHQLAASREGHFAHLSNRALELEVLWRMLATGGWAWERLAALYRQAHMLANSARAAGDLSVGAAAWQLDQRLASLSAARADVTSPAARAEIEALVTALSGAVRAGSASTGDAAASGAGHARGAPERQAAVLLVEQDADTAHHLTTQLEHFGYRAIVTRALDDLAQAIDAHSPTAIIMDIALPRDDTPMPRGEAGRPWAGGDAPLIFVSERGDFEARLWAVRAGGRAYLTKPVDIDTLVSILDALTGAFVAEPYRVLIVDDTRMMSALYEATLRDAGMLAIAINDPAQIMQALHEFQPDLLLLDMYMPDCTGIEVAMLIRQQAAFLSLPIVFLSGERDREHQLAALAQGGDDFLTKPITATQLVSAVASRAHRARAMRAQLSRDGLTGLLTHASIKERLAREISRARRYGTTLSVAMIDLDHFKQINDRYGHAAGDRVLKGLARLLHQRLRLSDSIGRYGGEEFLLILPQTDGPTAQRVLDDARARFASIGHQLGDSEMAVTFSGGVASLLPTDDGSRLLALADGALYAAKGAGRNRIALAEGAY